MEENNATSAEKKDKFMETYKDASKGEVLKELLYTQNLQLNKLEQIRSNTSKLVWWLVAIPILIFIFALILDVYRDIF